jgi:hypothetical protein
MCSFTVNKKNFILDFKLKTFYIVLLLLITKYAMKIIKTLIIIYNNRQNIRVHFLCLENCERVIIANAPSACHVCLTSFANVRLNKE